mgnify:CR=1 FL=1
MSEEKIFKLEGLISQQTMEALVKGFKGGNQCQTLLGGQDLERHLLWQIL